MTNETPTAATSPTSGPRKKGVTSFVLGASLAAIGGIAALLAGLVYAASSASPGYGQWIPLLEEQNTLWVATGVIVYVGLIALLIGAAVVVRRLRPKSRVGVLVPTTLAISGATFFIVGILMANAVGDFVVEVTPRYMSEAWEAVAPASVLSKIGALSGVLILAVSVVWLIVVAIRAGARRVSAR